MGYRLGFNQINFLYSVVGFSLNVLEPYFHEELKVHGSAINLTVKI